MASATNMLLWDVMCICLLIPYCMMWYRIRRNRNKASR